MKIPAQEDALASTLFKPHITLTCLRTTEPPLSGVYYMLLLFCIQVNCMTYELRILWYLYVTLALWHNCLLHKEMFLGQGCLRKSTVLFSVPQKLVMTLLIDKFVFRVLNLLLFRIKFFQYFRPKETTLNTFPGVSGLWCNFKRFHMIRLASGLQ